MIPPELSSFLQSGISILVGTRDARLLPEASRAVGVRIAPDGRELTVFLASASTQRALANVRDSGRVAVCFSAVDHRSYQVKGRALDVRPAREEERAELERWRAAVAQHWGAAGHSVRLTHRLCVWPAVALRVAVEAVFDQTPGPGAGAALSAGTARA